MTLQDIEDAIADHVHSAKCAIEAGFDGVEIVSIFHTTNFIINLSLLDLSNV
jgi:2,4-dienoyl-CoA reductase-like NADH-dependent reductase (Old Yellow Enzyme family)